ncbi:MAG: hypothetical protein ACRDD7_03875 [Peptostreptococcaceae bacterium]
MKEIWNNMVSSLNGLEREFPTNPKKVKKEPIWFLASSDGEKIYIDEARENSPSSRLKSKRILTYKDFEKIYPIHLRREDGESVSKEATEATRNQVYYFSLIKYLGMK